MASLCHPWLTTTNLSYKFPLFETSATALCGTTGIISYNIHIHMGVGWIEVVGSESTLVGSGRFGSGQCRWQLCGPPQQSRPSQNSQQRNHKEALKWNPKEYTIKKSVPTILTVPTIPTIHPRCWSRIVFDDDSATLIRTFGCWFRTLLCDADSTG